MPLHYDIEYSQALVNVRTSGVFDILKAYEMWKEIAKTCAANNCFQILGVSMLSEPMPQLDAYDHLEMLASAGISPKHRIAWIAGHDNLLENLRLIETVFKQRSSQNLRIFQTIGDAKRWLESGNR